MSLSEQDRIRMVKSLCKVQRDIIDECTSKGIQANITMAIQINYKSTFPHLDNNNELKIKKK